MKKNSDFGVGLAAPQNAVERPFAQYRRQFPLPLENANLGNMWVDSGVDHFLVFEANSFLEFGFHALSSLMQRLLLQPLFLYLHLDPNPVELLGFRLLGHLVSLPNDLIISIGGQKIIAMKSAPNRMSNPAKPIHAVQSPRSKATFGLL